MKQSKAGMLAIFIILSIGGSSRASMGDETRLAGRFSQLGVSYQRQGMPLALYDERCGEKRLSCHQAVLSLRNPGTAVKDRNWAIWFSSEHQILTAESDQFRITHIAGDLHRLQPTAKFRGLAAGQTLDIPVINHCWQRAII